jgi:hypothetical protein
MTTHNTQRTTHNTTIIAFDEPATLDDMKSSGPPPAAAFIIEAFCLLVEWIDFILSLFISYKWKTTNFLDTTSSIGFDLLYVVLIFLFCFVLFCFVLF